MKDFSKNLRDTFFQDELCVEELTVFQHILHLLTHFALKISQSLRMHQGIFRFTNQSDNFADKKLMTILCFDSEFFTSDKIQIEEIDYFNCDRS